MPTLDITVRVNGHSILMNVCKMWPWHLCLVISCIL